MTTKKSKHRKRYSITITTAQSKQLEANHLNLHKPGLKQICSALVAGLAKNYKNVAVDIVEKCPDLTEWGNLASPGISGHCKLAEIGGIPYLFNKDYQKTTTYEIPDIVSACGYADGKALVLGGGQAVPEMLGTNGLAIINSKIYGGPRFSRCVKVQQKVIAEEDETENSTAASGSDEKDNNSNSNSAANAENNAQASTAAETTETTATTTTQNTTTTATTVNTTGDSNDTSNDNAEESKTDESATTNTEDVVADVIADGPIAMSTYPSDEVGCASTLFLSDGESGPVIHLKVSVRTGELSLTHAIREALAAMDTCTDEYQIGLGGVIKVLKGRINASVQRDFIECDYQDSKRISEWKKQFECDENLVMFSSLLTGDPSVKRTHPLHLTLDNTYLYSLSKNCVTQAGKYVHDITPETVEYEAYFSVAESIYRIEDAFYNLSLIK